MSRIFLAMNGKRINTLDDLRSNFNPEQMLSFYRSGRLQKWLEESGATAALANINGFEANYDDETLLSMLMAVFEVKADQIPLKESLQAEGKIQDNLDKESAQGDVEVDTGDIELQEAAVELCVTCLKGIRCPGNVYTYPNFDTKKLNNAIKAFAKGITPNDVLLQIDTTLFGSATEGALITFDNIYYKDTFENEHVCSIRGEHQFSIKEEHLYKDDEKTAPVLTVDSLTRMKITSLLIGLQKTKANVKELLFQRMNS